MESKKNKVSYAAVYKINIDDSKKEDFVDEIKRIGIYFLKNEYPVLQNIDDSQFSHSMGYNGGDFVNNKISIRIEVKA